MLLIYLTSVLSFNYISSFASKCSAGRYCNNPRNVRPRFSICETLVSKGCTAGAVISGGPVFIAARVCGGSRGPRLMPRCRWAGLRPRALGDALVHLLSSRGRGARVGAVLRSGGALSGRGAEVGGWALRGLQSAWG